MSITKQQFRGELERKISKIEEILLYRLALTEKEKLHYDIFLTAYKTALKGFNQIEFCKCEGKI